MRSIFSPLVLVTLVSTGVVADIVAFGVPAIIQPGQPFNATYQHAIEQPSQDTIVWGYNPYNDNTEPGYMPQHNVVGVDMTTVSLQDYLGRSRGAWEGNITGLVVPGKTGDKVGIHAMIWGEYGVNKYVAIDSWLWNVTLGDSTSYGNYIMAEKDSSGPHFKRFNL